MFHVSESRKAIITLQVINEMDNLNAKMWSSHENEEINRASAEEMDERRHQNIAYEYLCHLEEAKKWIEACIREELPSSTELEENLRNGVYLAKLANFFCPEKVPFKKIYDKDQSRFGIYGLQFRHTDNINHWFNAMEHVGLPKIFVPETTDIYDRKNMPRVIYCLHALSLYLFKLGIAPQIQDLYGVAKFTEEEITTMAKELKKYGLQLPAFSKIGGILANEMPFDEAALHAAILAINDAIEKQNFENTLSSLKLYDAHLNCVNETNASYYQDCMYEAKQNKANLAKTKLKFKFQFKSNDINYVPDVYDVLLTQAEIQGYVNKVNVEKLISDINECVDKQDSNSLSKLLKSKTSPFKNLIDTNIELYMAQLVQEKESILTINNNVNRMLDKELIQTTINIVNTNAEERLKTTKLVEMLNASLVNNNKDDFLQLLRQSTQTPKIDYEYASTLYFIEFKNLHDDKDNSLDLDDYINGIRVLNAIVDINRAIDENLSKTHLCNYLLSQNAHLPDVNINLIDYYTYYFNKLKYDKSTMSRSSSLSSSSATSNSMLLNDDILNRLLTHSEIQDCVAIANEQYEQESIAINTIKDLVDKNDIDGTFSTIKSLSSMNDVNMIDDNYFLYFYEIKEYVYDNPNITIDNIRTIIENSNDLFIGTINMTKVIVSLNKLDIDDKEEFLNLIQNKTLNLNINGNYLSSYYETYKQLRTEYSQCDGEINRNEWLLSKTVDDKYDFYFNLKDEMQCSWTEPDNYDESNKLITRKILKNAINQTTEFNDKLILFQRNERLIVQLQACIKGYLTRRSLFERLVYINEHIDDIIKIQTWWRLVRTRRAYQARLDQFKQNESSIVVLQSFYKMWSQRRQYTARLSYLKSNEKAVIKIQSLLRAKRARDDYKTLMYEKNPQLSVVLKFVHLLEHNNIDFSEEIELQELKRKIITLIKQNKHLEQDLDMMDVKIGLLVKNRITLQDVLMQHKKLKKYKEDIELSQTKHIKHINKLHHDKIELYQNLFHLLQTQPKYLAKLLFLLPSTSTNKFIETVVLELFNYGSNAREEYLLLKLFTTALLDEIDSKVDKVSDIYTSQPYVMKVIVSLYRKHRGENVLRNILHKLIIEFLADKDLKLNLNPCEIYKNWLNRMETETGQPTGYSYDVTSQKALEYNEVRQELDRNIEALKKYTTSFLNVIVESIDQIPYGLRYVGKVLRDTLRGKFPSAPDRDILKVVGNLVYYRFINSAICQPTAFDIIDLPAGEPLQSDQIKNLMCLAKHLQLISMSKGYGDTENAHLSCLNGFIKECHDRMRSYFYDICLVQDSDEHFGIDEFSDFIVITKPVVYLTPKEICDTHKILLDYASIIAPDSNDSLTEILKLLGPESNVDTLINSFTMDSNNNNRSLDTSNSQSTSSDMNESSVGRITQLCITLTPRYAPNGDEKTDLHNLYIKTKRLIVDILLCSSGSSLNEILQSATTGEQEKTHRSLLTRRQENDRFLNSTNSDDSYDLSKTFDTTLDSMKKQVKANLLELEKSGILTNDYQSLLSRIAQDIRNQHKYRIRRQKEILHLNNVYSTLSSKNGLLKEQVSFYNEYVKACLDTIGLNKSNSKRSRNPFKRNKTPKQADPLKYTASKLQEKGVLLEIDGLTKESLIIKQISRLKHVNFEIIPTEEPGVFDVSAKFMNKEVEKVELVFQDLLQLQYEGKSIMKLFDRVKINVNLLIFLINKKFYGK